jgi:hypothetical protein
MTTAIQAKEYTTGVAVSMRVTVSNDNGLRDENGTATLNYWLYDANGNEVTSGNKPVNGTFCNGWDGSVNVAFNYIAEYLGVVII